MLSKEEKIKEFSYIRDQIHRHLLTILQGLLFAPSKRDYVKAAYCGDLKDLKVACKKILTLIEYHEKIEKGGLL